MIDDVLDLGRAREPRVLPVRQHFIEQMEVLLLLRGRVDQARIRRRVPGFEFLNALEVARIGHDYGEFPQLIELAQFRSCFLLFGGGSGHVIWLLGFTEAKSPGSFVSLLSHQKGDNNKLFSPARASTSPLKRSPSKLARFFSSRVRAGRNSVRFPTSGPGISGTRSAHRRTRLRTCRLRVRR